MYDRQCSNNHKMIDCYEPINISEPVLCSECGTSTERAWLSKPPNVVGDDIPGGVWIRHGLCDPVTGEPRKYYSKSEMRAEAKRRGLVNRVEHVTSPDTDKSPHTTRWI